MSAAKISALADRLQEHCKTKGWNVRVDAPSHYHKVEKRLPAKIKESDLDAGDEFLELLASWAIAAVLNTIADLRNSGIDASKENSSIRVWVAVDHTVNFSIACYYSLLD